MSDARTTRRASAGSEDRSSAGSVDGHIRSSPWRLHQDKTKTIPRQPAGGSVSSSSGVQQQEEAAAEGSRPSSSSLSPASRALEMADKRYEQELRARGAAGDGDSEDGSDDSIGPASRSTGRTSGVRSLSGPGDLGEGFRSGIGRRKNFVQERRGRNRTQGGSLLLRGSDSTPENSPASSRASSTDSWRQALARARGPNSPHKKVGAAGAGAECEGRGQAAFASVNASTGEDVDGMNVARLKARAVELGVPTSGRKPALLARIKEKMAADALAATNAAAVPVTALHPARKAAEATVTARRASKTSATGGRSADVDAEGSDSMPASMIPFGNDVCSSAATMAADGEGDRDAELFTLALDDEEFVTAEGWVDVDVCEDDGNPAVDARTYGSITPEAKGFPFKGGDVVERDTKGNEAAGSGGVDITSANVSRNACWESGLGCPNGRGSCIDCDKFIDMAEHTQAEQQQSFDSTIEYERAVLSSTAASEFADDAASRNVTNDSTPQDGTDTEGVGVAADLRRGETVVPRAKVEVSTIPSAVAASDNEADDGGEDGRPQVGQARADGENACSGGIIESCSSNDMVNTPGWLSAAEANAARFADAENATAASHKPVDATVGRDAEELPPPPPRSDMIYSLGCAREYSMRVGVMNDENNSKNGDAASQIGGEHGGKREETAGRYVANQHGGRPDDPPGKREANVDSVASVVGTACPENSASMAVESRPAMPDREIDTRGHSSAIGRSSDDVGVGRTDENGTTVSGNSKATVLQDAAAGGSTAGRDGATPNRPGRVSESGPVGISTEVDQGLRPATRRACAEEKNGWEERVPSAAELTEKFMAVARLWAPILMKAGVSAGAIKTSPASRRSVSPAGRGRATTSSPTKTSPTGTKNRDSATPAVAPTSGFRVDLLNETLTAKIKAKTLTLWLQRGSNVPFSEICATDGNLNIGSGNQSPSARRDTTASPATTLGGGRSSFAGDASARARAAAGAARMLRARAAGGVVGRMSTVRRLMGSVGGGSGRRTSNASSKSSAGGTGVASIGVSCASGAKGLKHKIRGVKGRLSVSPPRTILAGSASRLSSNSTSSAKAAAAAAVTGAGETRDRSGTRASRGSSVAGATRAKSSSGVTRISSVTGGATARNDLAAVRSSNTDTNTNTSTKSTNDDALARLRSASTAGLMSGVSPTGTGALTPESGTGPATPGSRPGIRASKTGSARTPPKRNPMFKGGVSPPRPPRGSTSRPGMAFTSPSAGGGEGVRGARRSAASSPRQRLGGAREANAGAGGAVSASKLPVEGSIRAESLGTPARIARLRSNYPTLNSAGRSVPSGPKPSTAPSSTSRPSSGARSGLFGTGSSPGMRGANATPPRSGGRPPAKGDALRVFGIETPSPSRGGTAARLLAGTNASGDKAAGGVSTPLRPLSPGS